MKIEKKNIRLAGSAVGISGSFLLIEHIYRYGFDISDILGHEYVGVIMLAVAVVLGIYGRE